MTTRRKFIVDSCSSCLGLLALTGTFSLLSGCAPIGVYDTTADNEIIRIPLTEIAPKDQLKIIRTKQLDYDILLVIDKNKNHRAMLMRCTHADNLLVASNEGLNCHMHGSAFNLKGEVITGPAKRQLKQYKTIEENDQILIYLT